MIVRIFPVLRCFWKKVDLCLCPNLCFLRFRVIGLSLRHSALESAVQAFPSVAGFLHAASGK